MSQISIVANADAQKVDSGTKAWQLFAESPEVIAARVNGELKDLAYGLVDDDTVEGVAIDSADGRHILRHSTAHVMAQAVQPGFSCQKSPGLCSLY